MEGIKFFFGGDQGSGFGILDIYTRGCWEKKKGNLSKKSL